MRRPTRRQWLWASAAVLLLVGLVVLAGHARVLGWVLQRTSLQTTGMSGSVWTGLRIEHLRHSTPGWVLEADALELEPLRWQAGALQSQLRVQAVRVQTRTDPAPKPAQSASALLRALDWPAALRLTQIDVAKLDVDGVALRGLRADLAAGGAPEALRLGLQALQWPSANLALQGALVLQPQGALSLQASALRAGTEWPLDARLQAQGSLDALPLTLLLQTAGSAKAELSATLKPLAAQPLLALDGVFSGLDTRSLHPQAPASTWDGSLQMRMRPKGEAGLPLTLSLNARNAQALRLDQGGWPLRAVDLQLALDPARWQALQLQQLEVALGSGTQTAGTLSVAPQTALPQNGQAFTLPLALRLSDLRQLDANWPALRVDGRLSLSQDHWNSTDPLRVSSDVQARALQPGALAAAWRLQAQATVAGQRVSLEQAAFTQASGGGSASLSGVWQGGSGPGWQAQAQAQVRGWSLSLQPWTAPSRLQGRATLQLQQGATQLTGEAALQLEDGNQLAGLGLTAEASWKAGAGSVQWRMAAQAPDAASAAAPTTFSASGQRAAPLPSASALAEAASWPLQQVQWRLPQLQRLKPLWQPWLHSLAGSSEGEAELTLARGLQLKALRAQARGLSLQQRPAQAAITLAEATGTWRSDEGRLQLKDLQLAGWRLTQAEAQGGWTLPWRWQADGLAPPPGAGEAAPPWRLEGQAAAPQRNASTDSWLWPSLRTSLGPAASSAPRWLALEGSGLETSTRHASLRSGQLQLWGETLRITQAEGRWPQGWAQRRLQVVLDGEVRPARWLSQWDPSNAWSGDLLTQAQFRVQQDGEQDPAFQLSLARLQGDLRQGGTAIGLRTLQAQLQRSSAGALQVEVDLQSSLLGSTQAKARTLDGGQGLSGQVQAQIGALHVLRPWLPAGLELRGQGSLQATLSGSLAQPRLQGQGQLQIERLQHASSGLGGRNGSLNLGFDEQRLSLRQFQLQGLGGTDKDKPDDGGWLRGSGELNWANLAAPTASLVLQAEAFRLLNRFDRQLVTTGQATVALGPQRVQLRGEFTADRGLLDISQGDAPSLDDDVNVRRTRADTTQADTRKPAGWQRDVDLRFNLGQALRLQGRGLASRLMGDLRFIDKGGPGTQATAQATGKIELGGGRYKAYGQTLDIESGELRFTGALDNPRLDILALRPNIEARVGVQVAGSAQSPRVRLYSEPEMPDNDKLAWLLLGRAPDELGRNDTALLQRAALALLAGEGESAAGQFMDRLGLTEFSVNNSDDAGTTLRLGAQLSRRWSVGYERSLNSATGSWQLVYRAGQRLRIRAQSGTDSAIDALWLWRFDKL